MLHKPPNSVVSWNVSRKPNRVAAEMLKFPCDVASYFNTSFLFILKIERTLSKTPLNKHLYKRALKVEFFWFIFTYFLGSFVLWSLCK